MPAFTFPPALRGERIAFDGLAGRVSYYQAALADGVSPRPPMLFIHSVNAAGSAAEVRPLYEHYAETRAVCAIDLPGFGCSDRSDRPYLPRLMTDAVHALVARTRAAHDGAQVDALVGLER